MFTLGKVLISTRGLALGNYHFYMNAKPSVAMVQGEMCQCPLGLIPHFYLTLKSFSCYFISVCQCPLGLIPHFYLESTGRRNIIRQSVNALSGLYLISTHGSLSVNEKAVESVNALSGLYLISTVPLQKPRFYAVSRACFCRYLSEYSDNSRFSCMLTFWTYLMRCTSP